MEYATCVTGASLVRGSVTRRSTAREDVAVAQCATPGGQSSVLGSASLVRTYIYRHKRRSAGDPAGRRPQRGGIIALPNRSYIGINGCVNATCRNDRRLSQHKNCYFSGDACRGGNQSDVSGEARHV